LTFSVPCSLFPVPCSLIDKQNFWESNAFRGEEDVIAAAVFSIMGRSVFSPGHDVAITLQDFNDS
jgi:hypothetical protein